MTKPIATKSAAPRANGSGLYAIEDLRRVENDDLLAQLRAQFGAPNYRPPVLPAIALQVHALTKRTEASTTEVVALVERDPMLAADVLRRAQSAQYAGRTAPETLRDAAMRLGMRGLAELVFEVALTSRVFRVKGLDGPMLLMQRHSVITAQCARAIAVRVRLPDPDAVFLGGLLHDVGLVAGLHVLAASYGGERLDLARAAAPLRDTHVEAGAIVAKLWGMSDAVRSIVEHHHAPFVVTVVDGAPQGNLEPLAACVALGDLLATELGANVPIGGSDIDTQSHVAIATALAAFSMTRHDLDEMRDTLGAQFVG